MSQREIIPPEILRSGRQSRIIKYELQKCHVIHTTIYDGDTREILEVKVEIQTKSSYTRPF